MATLEHKPYQEMTTDELLAVCAAEQEKLDRWSDMNLTLDLTRGKPNQAQLDLSSGLLSIVSTRGDCFSASGLDCRNYGVLDGLPETKQLFSDLLELPAGNILVLGNSSLNVIYDTLVRAMLFGVAGGHEPWCRQGRIKFICPSPGYDRHFTICRTLGIEMIPVPMKADGPDMDAVYDLACSDPSVKGVWCVPKFSNPEGITYSDEVVDAFAAMKPAAPDFRIFWDNAYAVHELYDENIHLANIFDYAREYGTEDNIFYFASTSKITFPGSGLAIMAASERNLEQIRPIIATQTIGYDKINQMRHVKFFGSAAGIREHMKHQANIIRPKFELVEHLFHKYLDDLGIAHWTEPRGGYFISLYVREGCARRVYQLARSVGVTLTTAGSTYPYGRDPKDSNLRIAPTYPEPEELELAIKILCSCIRLACAEKLLKA
ncbi:MAG: aminotransferase class I/II-fold pyridoxal phosphate-dependent enzyme [Clostridia bacterium]|nr:aminotransferase class I/II-fold pyridoxal phosphate-dependent enzyme [Clostridia bacterium]MCR4906565.1 aminotransferase class I/II-fold pyridoxal phosphate-dependent enzyme [Clostridiales bacterium]